MCIITQVLISDQVITRLQDTRLSSCLLAAEKIMARKNMLKYEKTFSTSKEVLVHYLDV